MSMETIDFAQLRLPAGARVLDLGCGQGRHCVPLAVHHDADVVGVDLGLPDLQTAAQRAADFPRQGRLLLAQGNALDLPFADNTFDVIICSEVLEHIADYRTVLAQIKRCLKKDGQLAISVPRYTPELICWQLDSAYYLEEGGHLRIFEAGALRAAVEVHGFHCTGRHWAHALHVPYWWLRCLFGRYADRAWPVRAYHQILLWDLFKAPKILRWLDRCLNPVMGKSVVFYFDQIPDSGS